MTGDLSFGPGQGAGPDPQQLQAMRSQQYAQYLRMLALNQAQAQDPHSQYLAQALQSIGAQGSQGNSMGLGSNLLADALDQYALNRRRQQLASQLTSPVAPDVQAHEAQHLVADPSQLPFNPPFSAT